MKLDFSGAAAFVQRLAACGLVSSGRPNVVDKGAGLLESKGSGNVPENGPAEREISGMPSAENVVAPDFTSGRRFQNRENVAESGSRAGQCSKLDSGAASSQA